MRRAFGSLLLAAWLVVACAPFVEQAEAIGIGPGPMIPAVQIVTAPQIDGPKEGLTDKSAVFRVLNLPKEAKPRWDIDPQWAFFTSRAEDGTPQLALLDPASDRYFIRVDYIEGGEIKTLKHTYTVGPPKPPVVVVPVPVDPTVPPVTPVDPNTKVTAVTYVYEKDQTPVSAAVMSALNTLNRRGIVANLAEDETTDGTGQPADQHRLAYKAAVEVGLPAMVFSSGTFPNDKVVRVLKDPKTEDEILKAVP